MTADFRATSSSSQSVGPDDDPGAKATWTEIVVTVAITAIAVLLVSFVAVVMGMA